MSEQKSTIMVTTLVSHRDRSGRVQIEGPGITLQLSSDEARALAENILQAATFAEADAFLFHWVGQAIGAGPQQAAAILSEFRAYRAAQIAQPPDGTVEP